MAITLGFLKIFDWLIDWSVDWLAEFIMLKIQSNKICLSLDSHAYLSNHYCCKKVWNNVFKFWEVLACLIFFWKSIADKNECDTRKTVTIYLLALCCTKKCVQSSQFGFQHPNKNERWNWYIYVVPDWTKFWILDCPVGNNENNWNCWYIW